MNIEQLKQFRTQLSTRHASELKTVDDFIALLEANGLQFTSVKVPRALAPPKPSAKPRKPAATGEGLPNLADAMREFIPTLREPFKSADLRTAVFNRYPSLKTKSDSMPINLKRMVKRGELRREGENHKAVYFIGKLHPVTPSVAPRAQNYDYEAHKRALGLAPHVTETPPDDNEQA